MYHQVESESDKNLYFSMSRIYMQLASYDFGFRNVDDMHRYLEDRMIDYIWGGIGMNIFLLGFSFGLGFIINYLLMMTLYFNGKLEIDKHSEEKDIYRLNLGKIERLDNRQYLILKIDKNADLTQK